MFSSITILKKKNQFILVVLGLSCSIQNPWLPHVNSQLWRVGPSSSQGLNLGPLQLGGRSLSHWTTWEVP